MYANCANWCKCESPAEGLVLKIERYRQRLTQGYSLLMGACLDILLKVARYFKLCCSLVWETFRFRFSALSVEFGTKAVAYYVNGYHHHRVLQSVWSYKISPLWCCLHWSGLILLEHFPSHWERLVIPTLVIHFNVREVYQRLSLSGYPPTAGCRFWWVRKTGVPSEPDWDRLKTQALIRPRGRGLNPGCRGGRHSW